MPETNEVEPLSDERLDMLEDDFRAGRGCFSGWGLALVTEVRQLRIDLALAQGAVEYHAARRESSERELDQYR